MDNVANPTPKGIIPATMWILNVQNATKIIIIPATTPIQRDVSQKESASRSLDSTCPIVTNFPPNIKMIAMILSTLIIIFIFMSLTTVEC